MEISICLLQPLPGHFDIAVPQCLLAVEEVQARILGNDLTVQHADVGRCKIRRLPDCRKYAEIALDHARNVRRDTVRAEAAARNHLSLIANTSPLPDDS